MKTFMDENFMLNSKSAQRLYHEYAANMPIIDYHNHLPPNQISGNINFNNLTQIWLYGDHYKWRAMRAMGFDEEEITGKGTDYAKFENWAKTVPYTLRNPLYHWTHMELQRYFGINDLLNPSTAKAIYDKTEKMLQQPDFSVHNLLLRMKVETLCTTDDPIDSLADHKKAAQSGLTVQVLPTWRPDKAMNAENPILYADYINKLAEVAELEIKTAADLIQALQKRHDYFHQVGCRISDHGIEEFYASDYSDSEIEAIFKKVMSGATLQKDELIKWKSFILFEGAKMDYASGWAQQFHYGVLRNNNSRMFAKLGPDTGYDSIGIFPDVARNMVKFFDRLASEDKLAKTIIYNINPADNEVIATMLGNFNEGPTAGKIQFGSGWWFLDQKQGMIEQMNSLSALGLISKFVGMLTDSRSFLSFPRHEYFRRIMCNLFGEDMENGELPNDFDLVGSIVQDISYNNAKNYFKF
jgi:glucuronate isomerase